MAAPSRRHRSARDAVQHYLRTGTLTPPPLTALSLISSRHQPTLMAFPILTSFHHRGGAFFVVQRAMDACRMVYAFELQFDAAFLQPLLIPSRTLHPPPVFLPAHIITGHHYHHPLLSVRRVGSGWRVCGDLGGVRSVGDGGGSVSSGEGRNIGDRWMQCV